MMPKKPEKEKRSHIIGVKVDELTKKKIDYIAEGDGVTTSTYLYNLINERIQQYTQMVKPNWDKELAEAEELKKIRGQK